MIGYQYLMVVDALDASRNPISCRFCCQPGFNDTGGRVWTPCIIDPGLLQITMFSNSKTYGASSYSYGEVILNNMAVFGADGPMDYLKNYIFGGRSIKVYMGGMNASFPSGFTLQYTATVESVQVNWETVTFTIRGRQAELDKTFADLIPGQKFLGTNTSATPPDVGLVGLEGTESDLKATAKPILIGRAFNFTPVCCNTARLIYAVSPMTGLSAEEFKSDLMVYDNGVRLLYGGTTTNIQTSTPLRGTFVVDTTGGYFRLGSNPVGEVTCSGVHKGYGLLSSPVNLIKYILNACGFSDMIDLINFGNYDDFDTQERGVYITGDMTVSEVIDTILAPLGYWYFSSEGKMQLGFLQVPSTMTPVYEVISDGNITTFGIRKSESTAAGVPAKAVVIHYEKNNTVQTTVAGSVTLGRKTWLSEEWRSVTLGRTGESNPAEEELTLDTALTQSAFLSEVHSLYCNDREIIEVEIISSEFLTAKMLQPGQCIAVNLRGRFDVVGKQMILIGITINHVDESVTLTLWG